MFIQIMTRGRIFVKMGRLKLFTKCATHCLLRLTNLSITNKSINLLFWSGLYSFVGKGVS